jgi:hypothetical protein
MPLRRVVPGERGGVVVGVPRDGAVDGVPPRGGDVPVGESVPVPLPLDPDDPSPEEPDDPSPEEPSPEEPSPEEPLPDDPSPEDPSPDEPLPDDPLPELPDEVPPPACASGECPAFPIHSPEKAPRNASSTMMLAPHRAVIRLTVQTAHQRKGAQHLRLGNCEKVALAAKPRRR